MHTHHQNNCSLPEQFLLNLKVIKKRRIAAAGNHCKNNKIPFIMFTIYSARTVRDAPLYIDIKKNTF